MRRSPSTEIQKVPSRRPVIHLVASVPHSRARLAANRVPVAARVEPRHLAHHARRARAPRAPDVPSRVFNPHRRRPPRAAIARTAVVRRARDDGDVV